MHVAFRVDASAQIGSGHVIRCLTLAHALKNKNHDVTFICRELTGNLLEHIKQNNFNTHSLPHKKEDNIKSSIHHANWLQVSWQTDAIDTINAIKSIPDIDWLVVDHYAIDHNWQEKLTSIVKNILAIDDLADRKHSVAVLLDQNYYADMDVRYTGLLNSSTKQLIGPKYTLLRDEFKTARKNIRQHNGEINNIFIFFGGTDKENLTLKSLHSLSSIHSDFTINVILGNTNTHKKNIIDYCKTQKNITCHSNVNNISTLMLQADLAIGAGGTTTWERCYLGLPAIVFTLAHNQAAVNEAVANLGACVLGGDAKTSETHITEHILKLIENPKRLTKLSKSALSIIHDHVGAQGVIETMESNHA